MSDYKYNYHDIPLGYYDDIYKRGKGIRSFWHWLKFNSVLNVIGQTNDASILDIGCFSGTFLSLLEKNNFSNQIGVDILEKQIEYANEKYGNTFRKFYHIKNFHSIKEITGNKKFDYITLMEVLEHLNIKDINDFFEVSHKELLSDNGSIVLTTPNYTSMWPLLEILINHFSDISYEEQHITKFGYFNIEKRIYNINNNLNKKFKTEIKTTSHFISPFISLISFRLAKYISNILSQYSLSFPFGSILIIILKKI